MDLRGYGETDKPRGIHEYVVDNMADDIKALIEGLGNTELFVLMVHACSDFTSGCGRVQQVHSGGP